MGNEAPAAGPLPFYYVMVVWGDKYVDLLLDWALPFLLAPGNLPGLSNLRESKFLFITTRKDAERIRASEPFKVLSSLMPVSFPDAPWIEHNIPYYFKAARGHKEAANLAVEVGAYCVYLAPDFLLSDGSLRSLVQMARSGKDAVLVPGIRVCTETASEEIQRRYPDRPGHALSIPPRSLVELCLRHIHAENQRYNWDHPCFSEAPVVCTWNVPGEHGLLIRAFHLHPLLVKMNKRESTALLESNTIDGEFLGFNFLDWDVIHIETDSDNIALFSFTDSNDRRQTLAPNAASAAKLRLIANSPLVNPLHRYYFTKAIKLHSRELNQKWKAVDERSALIAYEALSYAPGGKASDHLKYIPSTPLVIEAMKRVWRRAIRIPWFLIRVPQKLLYYLTNLKFVDGKRLSDVEKENEYLTNLAADLNLEIALLKRVLSVTGRGPLEATRADKLDSQKTDPSPGHR